MSAKSCAAHYLGELHAEEAVDGLSAQIGVLLTPFGHGPFVNGDEAPAANALIKIGTSSIPAVIRILSETDDGLTRFTCLQVLASIDRDNDVTQLRLEKALKAEKDGKKQSRFQAALKLRAEHLKATGQ
jgi:HEAT repeat protein